MAAKPTSIMIQVPGSGTTELTVNAPSLNPSSVWSGLGFAAPISQTLPNLPAELRLVSYGDTMLPGTFQRLVLSWVNTALPVEMAVVAGSGVAKRPEKSV